MANLRRTFKDKLNQKAMAPQIYPGILGDGNGKVDAGGGKAYVRIAGQVGEAVCNGVAYVNNMNVWVGYTAEFPTTLRVLGQVAGGTDFVDGVGKHATQHEWMGAGVLGGTDVLNVHLQQFLPLRVMRYLDYKVMVYPGIVWLGSGYHLVADINTQGKPVPQIIDLLTYNVGADKEKYLLITIDNAGDLAVIEGVEVAEGALTLADIPAAVSTTLYKLAAVRRYATQTEFVENREGVDIVDLRFPMVHSHPSGEITGITWDEVNKAGSSIADLVAKSHTSLTDIGTNTHEDIDEAITKLAANKITAESDLIYGIAVYSATLNRATVSQGASVTAISTFEGSPGNVIDEDDETKWAGASNPVANDWIRIDLAQERTIAKVRFYQFPYDGAWGATSYKVQGSNNDSSWTDIVTVNPTADDESFNFATPQTYRYFRFYALSGGGYSWIIYTIELLENEFVEFGLDNLPIGDTGEVLGVVSGKPAWVDNTGGGASALSGLTDVDLTGLSDDNVLVYDLASSKWKPEAQSGGGGGSDFSGAPAITASGEAIIDNPDTYVDVSLGLSDYAILSKYISIIPSNDQAAASEFWVSGITNSGFRINLVTTPTTVAKFIYHLHPESIVQVFTEDGTWDWIKAGKPDNVQILIVAGGGGGGGYFSGGGGGAGGLIYKASQAVTENVSIVVGAGGAGGSSQGTSGGNSSFGSLEAIGGGGGGAENKVGLNGGSGGGGGARKDLAGGTGTVDQGYAGGNSRDGDTGGTGGGGGGGGASEAGENVTTVNKGGKGGDGTYSAAFANYGAAGYFAGGGGGGTVSGATAGTGGAGGGGAGGAGAGNNGAPGIDGTGAGGGGGGNTGTSGAAGGKGGNGIVIVRSLF